MLRLLGIAISVGLADSLNPTTIAPALYLASGQRARERVAEFTFAVFLVYFLGGLAIAVGPGALLLSLIPHPHHRVAYAIELAGGLAILTAATLLWRHRGRLSDREPDLDPQGKSSWILGATITAIELPTAFPYFAVIAAVVSADVDVIREVIVLLVFNVCFVLPLIGIVATLTFAGDHAQRMLCRGRDFLQAHWPTVLAVLGVVAGLFVIVLGATGLASSPHNDFGQLMHKIRHRLLHPLK